MPLATPGLTNFTGGIFSRQLDGRVDLQKYFNACRTLTNFHPHPHGGVTRRSGFRFIREAANSGRKPLLIPFQFNASQTYVLELGEDSTGAGYLRVFMNQGIVLAGSTTTPYVTTSPYAAADLDELRWVQSNDTLFLVHPGYAPRKLVRKDHDDWEFSTISFTGQPKKWTMGNYPSVATMFEDRLVLAATPNEPSTVWMSRVGYYEDFRTCTREVPLDDWAKCKIVDANSDGKKDGKSGDTFKVPKTDYFSYDDTFLYTVKGETPSGTAQYFQYTGSKSFDAASAAVTVTFGTGIEVIYDADGNLNSDYWTAHALGDFVDYDEGDPLDDDGIELTLGADGGSASIYWMVSKSLLWLGTNDGTWTIGGSGVGTAVTPSSLKASRHDGKGVAQIPAVGSGPNALFVQLGGKQLLEMSYSYSSDSYVTEDLTLMDQEIGDEQFIQLAYCPDPDSILYCLRGDGKLAALTYLPSQDLLSWSLQETDGTIEAVTAIYGATENRTELWAVIRRTVNGSDHRYIEMLEKNFDGDDTKKAFFVDSGVSYSGTAATSFSGLDHLEGKTVDVLADGAVCPQQTVKDGKITLDRAASYVQVGLPYTSELETMRIEAGSAVGTSQGKRKRIVSLSVRLYKTLGALVGPSTDKLDRIYFRTSADEMGQPPALYTGDKKVSFPQGWNTDNIIVIIQNQPLPLTVLMLVPKVDVYE